MSMIASGYLEQVKLEPILIFILENAGRNASYDEFNEYFQKAFFDSATSEKQKQISWIGPKQAFSSSLPAKKKTLVMINAQWCSSCRVMKTTSFMLSHWRKRHKLTKFLPRLILL